ncbi:hypothetical protein [Okeania sp.]|uniref:hypothetical protein n=1 Tax=Okeania sp. TaxID=3100323 RepID=UPI002B4AB0D6|nr:hypothetical protein [Okeania sp.]MEB3341383.1 hypothetical protein [Okeania sp.]
MTTRKCPKCETKFKLPDLSFPFILPPTDHDYEWVDSSETLTCPHCNSILIVWARQYIYEDKIEIGELKLLKDGKENKKKKKKGNNKG